MSIDGALAAFREHVTTSLKELGDHLACAVCLSLPKTPIKLGCSHYLCDECAKRVFGNKKSTCPTCRTPCTKRESRMDERMKSIVDSFTNVLAAVSGAMGECDELPFGSQIPKEQLELHGAVAQRRTSMSLVKGLRAGMPGESTLRRAVEMIWEDKETERTQGRTKEHASTSQACETADSEPIYATWNGPLIDPNAEVEGITCAFCKRGSEVGEAVVAFEEKVSGKKKVEYCHETCAMWAPLTTSAADGSLVNVCKEVHRARRLRCGVCKKTGAPSGCKIGTCRQSFHIWCARLQHGTTFDEQGFSVTCPVHSITPTTPSAKRSPQAPFLSTSAKHRRLGSIGPSDTSYEMVALTKPSIAGSFLNDDEKKTIEKFCAKFDCEFEQSVSDQTTHVVMSKSKINADRCLKKRSDKFFGGLTRGCWIVSSTWLQASLKENRIVDAEDHEVLGDTRGNQGGPRRARLNKGVKIFSDTHLIYLGKVQSQQQLETSMQLARVDGAIVTRIEDAKISSDDLSEVLNLNDTSRVVVVVNEEQSNKAARARYAEEFIPFAKRLSKAAEAIVTHDFVLDSVCRREVMDLGDRSIEALESA